jgi:SAM-dependent methyltransferase
MPPPPQSERWKAEQAFFDQEEYSEGPLAASTIERYTACKKPYLPAEFPYWLLGDVRGKRILEFGSGDGHTSVLLALKGANVVGVDISPRAVSVATERARIHGVSGRASFHATPLELYLKDHSEKFDIICGFALLHHVLPELETVMANLCQLADERTVFLFVEPIALSRTLRRVRLALPIAIHGTPDERPLEPADLDILRRALPGMKMRYFEFLLRPWQRFIGGRYEDYSALMRFGYDSLARLDNAVLSLPGAGRLASTAAIYSIPPASPRG